LVYSLKKQVAINIHKKLFLIRKTEEKISQEYSFKEMRCPVHLSIGQEGVPAVLSVLLNKNDLAVSTHRGHAHYIGKNGNLKKMIAEIYGKKTGCSKGKGGSMHLVDKASGFYGTSAIVGNSIPVGVGLSYNFLNKKQKNLSVIYLGDGALEEGVFYESLNLSAVKNLPCLFICENNLYSVYSPLSVRQPKKRNIKKMIESIGVKSLHTDGNDIKKIFSAGKKAINFIKKKNKPFFLLFDNYRWLEHCGPNYDNHIGYRSKKEYIKWKKKDPLLNSYKLLKSLKVNNNVISNMEQKVINEINSAFKFAKDSKFPDKSDLMKDVLK